MMLFSSCKVPVPSERQLLVLQSKFSLVIGHLTAQEVEVSWKIVKRRYLSLLNAFLRFNRAKPMYLSKCSSVRPDRHK